VKTEPLPVEVRLDPDASPGQVVSALAALLLEHARQEINSRSRQLARRGKADQDQGQSMEHSNDYADRIDCRLGHTATR
jgi:hypothetical protein